MEAGSAFKLYKQMQAESSLGAKKSFIKLCRTCEVFFKATTGLSAVQKICNSSKQHMLDHCAMTCEALRSSADTARSSLRSSMATWALRAVSETSTRSADMSSACSASLASRVASSFSSLSTCSQGPGSLQKSDSRRDRYVVHSQAMHSSPADS